MKRTSIALFIASILIMSVSSGCRKDIYGCTDPAAGNYAPNANVDNGSCRYYGNVMFWFDANQGTGTVTINGQTGSITSYYTGGIPACGSNGTATFYLEEGSYAYNVTTTGGAGNSWTGTADVVANDCQKYELR